MRRARKNSQSLAERTRWLFTREGLPVLVSIVAGIVIGFFINGALGLVIATIAGFAVLALFKRFPLRMNPWQALVIDLTPVIGKLLYSMAFLLPIASYLTLPSGHTPNTLPKYLSIVVAIPKNLFSSPGSDIYPGFVFIVIISIVLMYWGSMNLGKRDHWLLSLSGLLLYTFSPTITGFLTGRPGIHILMAFFGVGYYFAWIGLLLLLAARFLPNFLKVKPAAASNMSIMSSLLPPIITLGFLSQFNTADLSSHFQLFQMFDFESTHHFVAGVISAGVAGVGAGVIIDQADEYGESFDTSEMPEHDAEIGPTPEEPPVPQGPVLSTDPDDIPGTTIEYNADGSITKRQPDGTWGTMYSDGTYYGEGPNGESYTEYPDGTTKEYSPETGLEVKHPNGEMEITLPDGRTGGITNNQDGSIDITSPYGGTLHCPKGEYPQGSITTYDGTVMTFGKDGSGSMSSPYGGKLDIDKDGNMTGEWTTEEGDHFTFNPDGSVEGKTADGGEITVDANGLKAKFKDGSYLNTDANGNPTSAHFKNEEGVTIDINTDDKGTMHIKDDQGNSADINKDGSGQMKDSDGNVATQDSHGNATLTNKEGTKWVAKNDGTGYVADKKGNRIDLNKDGSVTITEAGGKTTTYTADQVEQMKAQADSGHQAGSNTDSSAGGK